MEIYSYIKSSYNLIQLLDEVYVSINKKLYANFEGDVVDGYVSSEGDRITFFLDVALSAGEETSLSSIVTAHVGDSDYINAIMANVDMSDSNLMTLSLTSTTISATTYYSGSTNLETIINNIASTYSSTGSSNTFYVQPGTNTYTGGTINRPTVSVSALTINTLVASGGTIFNPTIGSGSISATTIINNVLTSSGAFITILRDDSDIISGLTKDNGIYGVRNFVFSRNSENKITGWTVN